MRAVVFNPRAGSGKTTVAMNFAEALARHDEEVTLIDLDPGMGMSQRLSPVLSGTGATVLDWVDGNSVQPTMLGQTNRLHFYSGHRAGLERLTTVRAYPTVKTGWQVIDTSSASASVLAPVLIESDLVILPVEPDHTSIDKLTTVVSDLSAIGVGADALRFLLTRYSNRKLSHQRERARLIEAFGSNAVLPVVIRSSAKFSSDDETSGMIFDQSQRSTGAGDFLQLARAILAETALLSKKEDRS